MKLIYEVIGLEKLLFRHIKISFSIKFQPLSISLNSVIYLHIVTVKKDFPLVLTMTNSKVTYIPIQTHW